MLEKNDSMSIERYPSQMDISFSEKCNQRCVYCWTDKSGSGKLTFRQVRTAVDIFLDLPVVNKTITFTNSEPLLSYGLYKKTVEYILKRSSCRDVTIVTTTNGILLDAAARGFIVERLGGSFYLNISLDGMADTHNAQRKLRSGAYRGGSAFELSWKNFSSLPTCKNVRVIMTVTPYGVVDLVKNVDFILDNGFRRIDLFPEMFVLWSEKDLRLLQKNMRLVLTRFDGDLSGRGDLRLLNRLWGASCYSKLLFASDARFYLFESVLALPYPQRKKYVLGDVINGIDLKERVRMFEELFRMVGAQRCRCCEYANFCSYPLPLFIWSEQKKKDYQKYLNNFCSIARMFIHLASQVNAMAKNTLDQARFMDCRWGSRDGKTCD